MNTNVVLITLFTVNLLFMGYFIVFVYNEPATQCLNDPLVYGFNKLQEANTDPLVCSCKLVSDSPSPTLYFDSEGRRFEDLEIPAPQGQRLDTSTINLSKITNP